MVQTPDIDGIENASQFRLQRNNKNNLVGILLAPILIFIAMLTLWRNEGRFDYHQEAVKSRPISSGEGSIQGETISYTDQVEDTVFDTDYLKQFQNYLQVKQQAQIYSWHETTKKGANSWSLNWHSYVQTNSRNSGITQRLEEREFFPAHFKMNKLVISKDQIHFVDDDFSIQISELQFTEKSKKLGLKKFNDYLYLSKGDPAAEARLGDERVYFRGIPLPDTSTYFGQLSDGQGVAKQFDYDHGWISMLIQNDGIVHHLVAGDRKTALESLRSHILYVKWLVRIVASLIMLLGFHIIFSSLLHLLISLPIIGNLVGMGSFIVSSVLTILLAGGTILSGYLYHHPGQLIFGISAILVILTILRRDQKSTKRYAGKNLQTNFSPDTYSQLLNHLISFAIHDGKLNPGEEKFLIKFGKRHGLDQTQIKNLIAEAQKGNLPAKGAVQKNEMILFASLAMSDGFLSSSELKHLYSLGTSANMSTEDVNKLVRQVKMGLVTI